jgi:RNase P subunit RPR2
MKKKLTERDIVCHECGTAHWWNDEPEEVNGIDYCRECKTPITREQFYRLIYSKDGEHTVICRKCGMAKRMTKKFVPEKLNARGGRELKPSGIYPKCTPKKR